MGKRKLIIGVAAGALLGAIAMQFDKDARAYTKDSIDKLKNETSNLISNPTEAVQALRETFDKLNGNLNTGADSAINALDQVENTLTKFLNK